MSIEFQSVKIIYSDYKLYLINKIILTPLNIRAGMIITPIIIVIVTLKK